MEIKGLKGRGAVCRLPSQRRVPIIFRTSVIHPPVHCPVQVDQRLEERPLRLPIGELGIKEAPFGIDDLDVARITVVVAQSCNGTILIVFWPMPSGNMD
jgi:hypothetical protein